MPLDAKSFEFEVFGSKNLEFEPFNILGPCPWILKLRFEMHLRFGVLDFQTSKRGGHPNRGFKHLVNLTDQPRILKRSSSRFLDNNEFEAF